MTGGSYVLSIWRGDARHTVLVWNGVEDYARLPSPENLAVTNMGGLSFGKEVAIVQLNRPVGKDGRSAVEVLAEMLVKFDSVILWAKDTATYESIRDELKSKAARKFDGTPKS